MTFGEKIKKLRIENKLTQQEFADKFYVTRQAVSRWEQGKSVPSIDVLELIAKEFNVSIDYLVSENDTNDIKNEEVNENSETIETSINKPEKYNVLMKVTFYSILSVIIFLVVFVFTYFTLNGISNDRYALYASPSMISKEIIKSDKNGWLTLGNEYYLSSNEGSWYIYSCHESKDDIEVEFVEEIFSTNDYFDKKTILSKKCAYNGIDTTFNYYRVPEVIEIISFDIYGNYLNKVYFSKDDIEEYRKYHMNDATSYTIKAYYSDNTTLIFNYLLDAEYDARQTSIYLPSDKVEYVLWCFELS